METITSSFVSQVLEHLAGPPIRRSPWTRSAVTAMVSVVTFSTLFVPWSQVGTVRRSGYALAHAVQQSGLISSDWLKLLQCMLIALPVCVGCCCAAALIDHPRVAVMSCGVVGLIVLVGALIVLIELGAQARFGAWIGAVVGGLSMSLAITNCVAIRRLDVRCIA